MPKKITKNQEDGNIGEKDFESWATKMHWHPTKLSPDNGIDYVCQIRGKQLGTVTYEMPGSTLNVSVRSTHKNSQFVKIDRNDAELMFTSASPMVFALVQRAPQGELELGKISIKFPDEKFLEIIETFLDGHKSSLPIRFSEAISDPEEIRKRLDELLKQPYKDQITRAVLQNLLKRHFDKPQVEIVRSASSEIAIVHSKDEIGLWDNTLNPEIDKLCGKLGMNVVFTPTSLISAVFTSNQPPKNFRIESFEQHAFPLYSTDETRRDSKLKNEKFCYKDLINEELSLWNYANALTYADQMEREIVGEEANLSLLSQEQLFLLSRVHLVCAEVNPPNRRKHLDKAETILNQIHSSPPDSINPALVADIAALEQSIVYQELGPEQALIGLAGKTTPYAIRIQVAILINQQKYEQAIDLVENQPPEEIWCDLAIKAFILTGRLKDAESLLQFAAQLSNKAKYVQCIVSYAGALFERALAGRVKGAIIHPGDLTSEERKNLGAALETIQPVLEPIVKSGQIESKLSLVAVCIAIRASYLLGEQTKTGELFQLIYRWVPVAIEAAQFVISHIVEAPPDLADRLRDEHPGDIEANFMAAVVLTNSFNRHEEALAQIVKCLELAPPSPQEKDISLLLLQLWQDLSGAKKEESEKILESLSERDLQLRALFKATKALHANDPKSVLRALARVKDENNHIWLQLRANALLQLRRGKEALKDLIALAKKSPNPFILLQTATVAYHEKEYAIAANHYERVLRLFEDQLAPDVKLDAHGKLAYLHAQHLRDLAKAVEHLRVLHAAEPEDVRHTVNLAACLSQLFRPQESLALYDEACRMDNPSIQAVLGRVSVLRGIGKPDAALSSFLDNRIRFSSDIEFLITLMNVAYEAGDEAVADNVLKDLQGLQGATEGVEQPFRMVPQEEGLALLKNQVEASGQWNEKLHGEMLHGRMPWVWADQESGIAIYSAWRVRTHETAWLGDSPINRANFSIYSTNFFHPQPSERGQRELLPLECPPPGTTVVADLSALITLHRLGLLEMTANYFGEVLVPEGYLPHVLEDSRKMVLSQRTRRINGEKIWQQLESRNITVLDETRLAEPTMVFVDEYSEPEDHCYRIYDLLLPLYQAGVLSDCVYGKISSLPRKESAVDEDHPELGQLQDILIGDLTLATLAQFDCLEAVIKFYTVHTSKESADRIQQGLNSIRLQEETRQLHIALWSRLRDDPRFRFVAQYDEMGQPEGSQSSPDILAFLGCMVALKAKAPLLADDRVCQAMVMNERKEAEYPSFGAVQLISSLTTAGRLAPDKAAEAILRLMQWRYRFILPTATMLKAIADNYRFHPPGSPLQKVAEYAHDCMRDRGLFAGDETKKGESMATKLYMSWVYLVSDFIVSIWQDLTYPEDVATRLTEWCVRELLPSPPYSIKGIMKARLGEITPLFVLSHTLTNTSIQTEAVRTPEAITAIKAALGLDDEEYLNIVTEILNVSGKQIHHS